MLIRNLIWAGTTSPSVHPFVCWSNLDFLHFVTVISHSTCELVPYFILRLFVASLFLLVICIFSISNFPPARAEIDWQQCDFNLILLVVPSFTPRTASLVGHGSIGNLDDRPTGRPIYVSFLVPVYQRRTISSRTSRQQVSISVRMMDMIHGKEENQIWLHLFDISTLIDLNLNKAFCQ